MKTPGLLWKHRNKKGFTLIELLVVIAIIGILSAIGVDTMKQYQAKARDAIRMSDLRTIYTALQLYQTEKGGIPRTASYGESNAGGWDYSSQGGFLTFLVDDGYLEKVPVDPINDMVGDLTPGQFAYKYYCYDNNRGLSLRYRKETLGVSSSFVGFHNELGINGLFDSSFTCKN